VTRSITAATRVAGIIGDPVAHSLSPTIHNAAFDASSLDWVYVAFPVPAGAGAEAVRAMRMLGLGGLSVTMPHKVDAAAACDELSDDARTLGSVNTIVPLVSGGLRGESTDGDGFLRALAAEDFQPDGRSCLVLGAGGAARAIVLALGRAGANVTVAARRADAARAAAALAVGSRTIDLEAIATAVAGAELIVNATPLGMNRELPPFDPSLLHKHQVILDAVYFPSETPLIAAARACGARATNGLAMLVHQAALQFELWTGKRAPLDEMRMAAMLAVEARVS
jgi:shikimate dehydrogenase